MKFLSLMKKEFRRFFSDYKLICSMLLPGLLLYLVYSIMGQVMWDMDASYAFDVEVSGSSAQIEKRLNETISSSGGSMTLKLTPSEGREASLKKLEAGEITAYLYFSDDFDEAVADYDGEGQAPQVEIFYRSADTTSSAFYMLAVQTLDMYESQMTNKFDVNSGLNKKYDFSGETGGMQAVFSGILPFLVVALIFSSALGVTLESVAGEKERGTLATILVTPVKRSSIALGKVIPLSCFVSIGALSSFLGVALSLPKLAGVSVSAFAGSIGFLGYFLLFLLILSIVPLLVSLIATISTFSKTVKEASAYSSVAMILLLVLSVASGFVDKLGAWTVALPVINSVVAMKGVMMSAPVVWQCLVSVVVNIGYTALLVLLIAKMLSSERIMFGK